MSFRFWMLAGLYHAGLMAILLVRARGWIRRDSASLSRGAFWGSLLIDVSCFGVTAVILAVFLAGFLPDPAFAVIRFWAQTLFGEMLLYLLFLSILHWRGGLAHRSALMATLALMLLAVYVDAYHVEPERLQVEEHEVSLTESPRERPSRTIRLLHISDIQADRIGEYEERVVKRAAQLEPDLVIMTGDYVHERLLPTSQQTLGELVELLRRHGPRPPLGTWAVDGDTDSVRVEKRLTALGIRWLEDEAVTLSLPGGPPLTLIGLASWTSRGRNPETLRQLLSQAPAGSPRIVFGHAPDYVLGFEDDPRIELALAGHTHGGQIVVPFFGPPLTLSRVPRSVAAGGLHELGGVRVHVSRGVGLERGSAPQIRLFCPRDLCPDAELLIPGSPRDHRDLRFRLI